MNLSFLQRKAEPSEPFPVLTEHEAFQLVGFHDAMEAQNREEGAALLVRLDDEIEAKQEARKLLAEWLARPVAATSKPTRKKAREAA